MRKQLLTMTALAVVSTMALAGCSGSESEDSGDKTLTVWTVEDVADRVAAQEAIFAKYTEETGVKVDLVAVAEDQLTTVLTSSAAAGELPDVIGALSLNGVNQLATDDLLDLDAPKEIIDKLGADTFSERALELTSEGDTQLAVPSDGWAQLLYYRTDLFEAAGLDAPSTFDDISAAAAALDSPDVAGIVASTAPADSFTQQTFEHFALANDCQLVDDDAKLTLDSPECVEALGFYADLLRDSSVQGNQDADTTRATYFSGGAAMVVWSSFLLDELAGLRNDALPTCAECAADPGFLAANTGVVSAIEGPSGSEPASFGEIVSWSVLQDASPEAQGLVEYMMGDGYNDWLAVAPEGKVPTRTGTADEPGVFSDGWQQLEAGVDTKALLSSVYSADILDSVIAAPDSFNRWGIPQGQGALAAAVGGQFVVPQAIASMLNSGVSAEDAAKEANDQATTIQEDLDF
jgi:multiple sugar transport system substrate-binding protein